MRCHHAIPPAIQGIVSSRGFRQGHSDLDLNFTGNKEALDKFVRAYNSHPHKSSVIHIMGYASPEGTVAVNQRLSRQRADVIASYLQHNCNIPADSIVSVPIGVDWQDLYTAVLADHNMPGRERALDIIKNVPDIMSDSHGVLTSRRNNLLKRIENGRTWSYMLKNIYPYLRGAKAEAVCVADLPAPEEVKASVGIEALPDAEMSDTVFATPLPRPVNLKILLSLTVPSTGRCTPICSMTCWLCRTSGQSCILARTSALLPTGGTHGGR